MSSTTQQEPMESQKLKLQVKSLEAQVKVLKLKLKAKRDLERNYDPIQVEIVGTWQPISLAPLESDSFSEKQQARFWELFYSETNSKDMAVYSIEDGTICLSGTEMEDCYPEEEYTYRKWTSIYSFADGEVQKIVRTIKDDKLKMVLEANGEKCTVFFGRVESEEEKEDEEEIPNYSQEAVKNLLGQISILFYIIVGLLIWLLVVFYKS